MNLVLRWPQILSLEKAIFNFCITQILVRKCLLVCMLVYNCNAYYCLLHTPMSVVGTIPNVYSGTTPHASTPIASSCLQLLHLQLFSSMSTKHYFNLLYLGTLRCIPLLHFLQHLNQSLFTILQRWYTISRSNTPVYFITCK